MSPTADGRIYGNTAVAAFALDARTGRQLWSRRLTTAAQPITIAPALDGALVVTSTTGASPGGRGTIVALDASNGAVRWRFDTIAGAWAHPKLANGGGAWYTPTIDGDGNVWVGTAESEPVGRQQGLSKRWHVPGAGALHRLAARARRTTGRLLFSSQVTPHDIRDYDFEAPPVFTPQLVVGAGKAGRVIAWSRSTRARVWSTSVGLASHDSGRCLRASTSVCPGLLGGVETPLAVAGGRVFVPVVDLCFHESALGTSLSSFLATDYTKARGELVALDLATGSRSGLAGSPRRTSAAPPLPTTSSSPTPMRATILALAPPKERCSGAPRHRRRSTRARLSRGACSSSRPPPPIRSRVRPGTRWWRMRRSPSALVVSLTAAAVLATGCGGGP